METALRRWSTLGIAVGLALTVLGFLGSWRSVRQSKEWDDWVVHTYAVKTVLEATVLHSVNIESGARGFAVTGEEEFLVPYLDGLRDIARDLDSLQALTADNPAQQERLARLREQVTARIESARLVVEERRRTGEIPSKSVFMGGKQRMDAVRATLAEMQNEETERLKQRVQAAGGARHRTEAVIVISALVGVSLLGLAGMVTGREINRGVRMREQIQVLNTDLEQRVAQRTAALGESEGRLAGVIQSAMDSILTVDEQQNILLFNSAAERMFRCPAAEAIGQPISRFIPERLHAAHAGHVRNFGDTGVTNRIMGAKDVLRALRADGQEFQIEASISQVVTGGKKLFTVILRDVTERVQAETVREHLAAVVNSSDDAIISKDLNGTINGWNRGAEKIFGYPAPEVMGRSVQMLFPPERATEENDILARIGRGESVEHFESLRIRKDGKRIDVSVTISPIRDSSGAIVGASKIARDITQRKRAEAALAEQAEELSRQAVELVRSRESLEERTRMLGLVLQSMGEGLIAADREGRFLIWNDSAKKLLGRGPTDLSPEQWAGHYQAYLPDGVTPCPTNRLPLVRALHGESVEVELVIAHPERESGAHLAFTGRPLKDDQGKLCGGVVAFRDITERKRAEAAMASQAEELRRSREALEAQTLMLRSVLDSMVEGLVAADEQGKFILWNPAAERIIGMGAANLSTNEWTGHYGLYLADSVTPFPTEQNPLFRAIHGQASSGEMFVRNPELAEGVWVEANASPLKDKEGVVRGGVVAFRDITQRRADRLEIRKLNDDLELRVQKRTAQLEAANKEMEMFTYSVSHDLRAPLRHISAFSKLLMEEFHSSLPAEAQQHVQRIMDGTRRMGMLVDDLLNLARVGRRDVSLQVAGLKSIVQEVIESLQPDFADRQVEWKIGDLPFVECDTALMAQVFQNLLANALKFTRPRATAVIEIGEQQENGASVIFVRDNGVGFSMKYAQKLFGVFQRLHRPEDFEGTGVGLATVQRIIHKHGGRIWVEAELDKGTTFYFTLGTVEQTELRADAVAAGEKK